MFWQPGLRLNLSIDICPDLAGCLLGLIPEEKQLPGLSRELLKGLQILTEIFFAFLWTRYHS